MKKRLNKKVIAIITIIMVVILAIVLALFMPKNQEKSKFVEDYCEIHPEDYLSGCTVFKKKPRRKATGVALNATSGATVSVDYNIAAQEGGMGGFVQDEDGNVVVPSVAETKAQLSKKAVAEVVSNTITVSDNSKKNSTKENSAAILSETKDYSVVQNDAKVSELWNNPTTSTKETKVAKVEKVEEKKDTQPSENKKSETSAVVEVKKEENNNNVVVVSENATVVNLSEKEADVKLDPPATEDNSVAAAFVEEPAEVIEEVVEEEVSSSAHPDFDVYQMSVEELMLLTEEQMSLLTQDELNYVLAKLGF